MTNASEDGWWYEMEDVGDLPVTHVAVPLAEYEAAAASQTAGGGLTGGVLLEVLAERKRQDERWGQQNHPWFSNETSWSIVDSADEAKWLVDRRSKGRGLDYAGILTEEYHEALEASEESIARVREELVQVAAVAVAAIESIDRNGR